VHCHVLRAFAADAPHQLAEARLGILQEPVARAPVAADPLPAFRLFLQLRFCNLVKLTRLHTYR
jgi:hypothetical protein